MGLVDIVLVEFVKKYMVKYSNIVLIWSLVLYGIINVSFCFKL